jgi:hypothetical protein
MVVGLEVILPQDASRSSDGAAVYWLAMPRLVCHGFWRVANLILLSGLAATPALAQSEPAAVSTPVSALGAAAPVVERTPQGVVVHATRIASPITLDGRLDDGVYRDVPSIGDFVQQEPLENAPASERSEAWVLFDATTLYVSVRNWDSQPHRMVMNELRRDSSNLIQNEQITLTLDPLGDKRNGVLFLVNALGGMLDETFFDERNPSRDWNAAWNARTAVLEDGWSLEIAIPFRALRYVPGEGHPWGIQINRQIRHKNERTWLAPVPRSFGAQAVFRVSAAARLEGLVTPPLAKNLELKPYVIGGITTDRVARPAVVNDLTRNVGLDVKYGVTRSLTGDVTVNTDFAQVEDDEQQVNLTRFNLLFPEKREFFLEGQGIFNFGGRSVTGASDTPILFFSRQIGLSQGRPVPIVAGGRLTGRAGAFNLGAVNIQTDDQASVGAVPTNFTALRVRRDVLRRSTVGALFTGRSHAIGSSGANTTVGVDGVFSLFDNVRIDSYVAKTGTSGRSGDDLSYRGAFNYNADRYGLDLEHLAVGRNFNPEVGFVRRLDFRKTGAGVRFSPRPRQARTVRKYYYEAGLDYYATGTGRLESRTAWLAHRIELQNSDRFNVEYNHNYDRPVLPFRIAPGVTIPLGAYSWQTGLVSYQLGTQRRVNGTFSALKGSFYDGDQTTLSYRGRLALATHLSVEPQVSVNRVSLPAGRFTATLVGSRVTAPFTPRMYLSALLQYNSTTRTANTNVRFRWEYEPRSELFVVYSEGRNTTLVSAPAVETRGFVVKVTKLFMY